MNDVVGHVGAWAPRPEQVATAKLLVDHARWIATWTNMRREASVRLDAVYEGLTAMQRDGLPVEAIRTASAPNYVRARFAGQGFGSRSTGNRLWTSPRLVLSRSPLNEARPQPCKANRALT